MRGGNPADFLSRAKQKLWVLFYFLIQSKIPKILRLHKYMQTLAFRLKSVLIIGIVPVAQVN
ncbi:MAG TPA: hypothetical protein DCG42_03480, partial [Maribacter sp.]|nr:hypothetical protein [Maribacter sp.]